MRVVFSKRLFRLFALGESQAFHDGAMAHDAPQRAHGEQQRRRGDIHDADFDLRVAHHETQRQQPKQQRHGPAPRHRVSHHSASPSRLRVLRQFQDFPILEILLERGQGVRQLRINRPNFFDNAPRPAHVGDDGHLFQSLSKGVRQRG